MANYNKFAFNPTTGFLDGTSYPNPANETAARTQMQSLHNQTRDYLNTLCNYYGSSDSNVIRFRVDTNAKLQYSRDGEVWNDVIPAQVGTSTVGSATNPVYLNNGTVTQCTLSSVASSGNYNDLSNKPALKTVATSGSYNDLSNRPSLSAVATSGSYNDLTNKPSIPSVGNGTIAIQMNGTTKGSFTTNQSGNTTVNLGTVITSHQSLSGYQKAITVSTSNPSGGSNGDIWLKRES